MFLKIERNIINENTLRKIYLHRDINHKTSGTVRPFTIDGCMCKGVCVRVYEGVLPAGCLWDSIRWRCRCWEGRCRLRWTWLDGWTERLSSENNHTNTLQLWVQLFPNITFPNPMETADWRFIYIQRFLRITLPAVLQNSLFAVGSFGTVFFLDVLRRIPAQGTLVETCACA